MTDYTGVPLEDILSHLLDWRDETVRAVGALKDLRTKTEEYRARLDWPDDIIASIDFFVDLLTRYIGDFDALAVVEAIASHLHGEILALGEVRVAG